MRLLFLFLLGLAVVAALPRRSGLSKKFPKRRPRHFLDPAVHLARRLPLITTKDDSIPDPTYLYEEKFFEGMPLDHFGYTDNRTFTLRYLINTTWYEPDGVIFFYTGNEGAIENFAIATGIMWDLAKRFKAALIFAEHRYYGKSQPFGTYDESYSSTDRLGFLTSAQALGDFAHLLTSLKSSDNEYGFQQSTRVITFGGSYGGMLATWFRQKYPHITVGAWASSAPVLYFKGAGVDWGAFDARSTKTFAEAGAVVENVNNGWKAIKNLASTDDGRSQLNKIFHIAPKSPITKPRHGDILIMYLQSGIEYMAMVDYPYPTGFMQPLPGWPVEKSAFFLSKPGPHADIDLASYMYEVMNIYYNTSGNQETFCIYGDCDQDVGKDTLGSPMGWPWQECTEIIIEMCSRGPPNDFFFNDCEDTAEEFIKDWKQGCVWSFGDIGLDETFVREREIEREYGLSFFSASNLILTNGELDPWSVGGVKADTPGVAEAAADGVYNWLLPASAHHLDLRQPNTCDPNTVRNARYQIYSILWCWAYPQDCDSLPKWQPLPDKVEIPEGIRCEPEIDAYPWGQGSKL